MLYVLNLVPVRVKLIWYIFSGAGTEAVSHPVAFPAFDSSLTGQYQLAATLSFFMLAMLLYPRVQDKLRAEIDGIVGHPDDPNCIVRSPTFQDTCRMPYLHAVIKEVMRYVLVHNYLL